MIRLFAAVEIPEDVKAGLVRLQQGLPGARWSPEDNLHITLAFIGEQPEPLAEEIAQALAQIAVSPFEIALAGLGTFGGDRRNESPRVLFAQIEHGEALPRLAQKIETAVRQMGVALDRRKYHPHVTLARLKDARSDRIASYMRRFGLYRSRSFEVTSFTLFESIMGRAASVYRPLATYDLG